jgi:exodeoxyribonuclease-3
MAYVDGFREVNKEPKPIHVVEPDKTSIREENKGWRIDYINVTENLGTQLLMRRYYRK